MTDSLGIAALWAVVIAFLPAAWDVVLHPVAGRISDRTVDPVVPAGPRRLRAGLALAACLALVPRISGEPVKSTCWMPQEPTISPDIRGNGGPR